MNIELTSALCGIQLRYSCHRLHGNVIITAMLCVIMALKTYAKDSLTHNIYNQ